jgi:hypothetical protein
VFQFFLPPLRKVEPNQQPLKKVKPEFGSTLPLRKVKPNFGSTFFKGGF